MDTKREIEIKEELIEDIDDEITQILCTDVGQGRKGSKGRTSKRNKPQRVESREAIEGIEVISTYNCLSPSTSWGGIVKSNSPEAASISTGITIVDMQKNDDPWPYMSNYFRFKGKGNKEGNLLYECVQCLPQLKVISTSIRSRNNLKKHLESLHSHSLKDFETCILEGSKAAQRFKHKSPNIETHEESIKRRKLVRHQSSLLEARLSTTQVVNQTIVEERVMSVFMENILPFEIVESASFKSLLELMPGNHNLSTSSLKKHIEERFEGEKNKLKVILEEVPFVATTADAWTCRNKSYLGMTVHWIDCATMKRKQALLACKCIKEPHRYDVIAKTIQDIHSVFGIERKVNRTTTDNGSNFVKPLSVFGGEEPEGNLQDPEDETHIVELTPILEEQPLEESGYDLPKHSRCAAHVLNLVATTDADNALENAAYRKACRDTFAKANKLWDKYHSSQASDVIKDDVGQLLTVPDNTKWNSIYDGVTQLVQILDNKDTLRSLQKACTLLRIPSFSSSDMTFLREYQQVMRPVAKAFDILHKEERAFMGALLPTISICLNTLKDQRENNEITLCQPLVEALIHGLMERFSHLFNELDCLMSTALNPQFKLALWPDLLPKESFNAKEMKKKTTNHLLTIVEKLIMEKHKEGSCVSGSEEEDYFQSLYDSGKKKEESGELVRNFLDTSPHKKVDANCFPSKELLELFIKFNTPIPSSAAFDLLFSLGKDVLKPKWSGLSDEHFEMLVFLKGNAI